MYYPGVDFWDGQTQDQTILKMEAVVAREYRELIRSGAAFGGLEDVSLALPNWYKQETTTTRKVTPFSFSLSAQRGIVEAVELGLVPEDVWADQVIHAWENLLAATGDLSHWREREAKNSRARSK